MTKNPWAERYACLLQLSDKVLLERLTVMGQPNLGVHDKPAETAAGDLRKALAAVHIPDAQELSAIRRILGRAHGYALVRYSTPEAMLAGIYERDLLVEPLPATVVTGPAGCGKSAMGHALFRLVGAPSSLELPDGTQVPLLGGLRYKLERDVTETLHRIKMLKALGASEADLRAKSQPLSFSQKRAYVAGCAFTLLDEMQFVSQSSAHALVTKILLTATYLGPPLVYVANFSLLHRLLKRNQEDQQRLLSDVICLTPPEPESPEAAKIVEEWCTASDGVLDLNPTTAAHALDGYTGGSRRPMLDLIERTYLRKRLGTKAKRVKVTMADIDTVYRKEDSFASLRIDAELIMKQRASGRQADKKRRDLWNPLTALPMQGSEQEVKVQEKARRTLRQKMDERLLHSSMTPAELKAAEQIHAAAREGQAPAEPARVPKVRGKAPTFEELLGRRLT